MTDVIKVSSQKWPKQSECEKFFGPIGLSQYRCKLPFPMFVSWDNKKTITCYSCHKLVKEPMERIWQRTLDHYGHEKIKELRLDQFGGCLSVRRMRGGSSWSMHSWGIAVDIDPDNNEMRWGKDKASLARPEYKKFWEFVYDEGAISLGVERDFDWMHFQFARLK